MRTGAGRATTQQGGTQEVGQGFNQLKQGVKEGAEKVRRLPHTLKDCPCSGMVTDVHLGRARSAMTRVHACAAMLHAASRGCEHATLLLFDYCCSC